MKHGMKLAAAALALLLALTLSSCGLLGKLGIANPFDGIGAVTDEKGNIQIKFNNKVVITSFDCSIFASPDREGEVLEEPTIGRIFDSAEEEGDWYKVGLGDGKYGFVPSDAALLLDNIDVASYADVIGEKIASAYAKLLNGTWVHEGEEYPSGEISGLKEKTVDKYAFNSDRTCEMCDPADMFYVENFSEEMKTALLDSIYADASDVIAGIGYGTSGWYEWSAPRGHENFGGTYTLDVKYTDPTHCKVTCVFEIYEESETVEFVLNCIDRTLTLNAEDGSAVVFTRAAQ